MDGHHVKSFSPKPSLKNCAGLCKKAGLERPILDLGPDQELETNFKKSFTYNYCQRNIFAAID
jgi:hypothetical protein